MHLRLAAARGSRQLLTATLLLTTAVPDIAAMQSNLRALGPSMTTETLVPDPNCVNSETLARETTVSSEQGCKRNVVWKNRNRLLRREGSDPRIYFAPRRESSVFSFLVSVSSVANLGPRS